MADSNKDKLAVHCIVTPNQVSVDVSFAIQRMYGDGLKEVHTIIISALTELPKVIKHAGDELVRQGVVQGKKVASRPVMEHPKYDVPDTVRRPGTIQFFEFALYPNASMATNDIYPETYIGKEYSNGEIRAWKDGTIENFCNKDALKRHYGKRFKFLSYHGTGETEDGN